MARSGTMMAANGRRVLAILLLAYIFNFLDRQIVSILAEPIKKDLGLSDGQLGLMGGLAFALFYTGLGIPIAWLADRKSRVTIISVSLALWSGFTALCGFAGNFRSEEHTSELQSLMRISYAVFCLKKKNKNIKIQQT